MASESPSAGISARVAIGTLIAEKYRVERLVGEGGMGYVVAARHTSLGELYAIKLLPHAADETLRKRFLREAQAAGRITSAHIAKVYDVGETADGTAYMVMELLAGEDLDVKLQRDGAFGVETAVDFIVQACEALAEAHDLGIVHRDVKPSNLFLTTSRSGRPMVKLLDFGISKGDAKGEQRVTKLTRADSVLGSPQFMAPEQLVSSSDVDARADIWSLGVTLFELLTTEAPFDGDTMADLYAAILRNEPRPLTSVRPDLPVDLERVVNRCLEKDAYDRYESVAELVQALAPHASSAAQSSVARISRSSTSPNTIADDLVATTRQVRGGEELMETMVPLVRRMEPAPSQDPLLSAATTVMERSVHAPAPLARTLASPPAFAPPQPLVRKRRPRWPLVLLLVLAIAVLIAGATRFYLSQRDDVEETSDEPRKSKRGGKSPAQPRRDDVTTHDATLSAADRTEIEQWLQDGQKALADGEPARARTRARDVRTRLHEHEFRMMKHDSPFAARAKALEGDIHGWRALAMAPGQDSSWVQKEAMVAYGLAELWDKSGSACVFRARSVLLQRLAA